MTVSCLFHHTITVGVVYVSHIRTDELHR